MKTTLSLFVLMISMIGYSQIVNIPDPVFKDALVGNSNINTNGDDEIQVSEAIAYDQDIFLQNFGVNDLTGIEAFVNLTRLNVNENNLTELDLTNNVALTEIICRDNQLTSLDITGLTSLTNLVCYYNQLTQIDVSTNLALTEFSCRNNLLTSLDISNMPNLVTINCNTNQMTSIDVSNSPMLQYLDPFNNQLESIDVSTNTALTHLIIRANDLSSIDVSNNPNLRVLNLGENELTALDISQNPLLEQLIFQFNMIPEIDLSNNPNLELLSCDFNLLTELDVRNNPVLDYVWCHNNYFTELDFSQNPLLYKIYCNDNLDLTYINLKNGNNENFDYEFCRFDDLPNLAEVCVDDLENTVLTDFILNEVGHSVDFSEDCILTGSPDFDFVSGYYPNPARNILNIQTNSRISIIRLFDGQGKMIRKVKDRSSIGLEGLPEGLYFCQVENTLGQQQMLKVSKSH